MSDVLIQSISNGYPYFLIGIYTFAAMLSLYHFIRVKKDKLVLSLFFIAIMGCITVYHDILYTIYPGGKGLPVIPDYIFGVITSLSRVIAYSFLTAQLIRHSRKWRITHYVILLIGFIIAVITHTYYYLSDNMEMTFFWVTWFYRPYRALFFIFIGVYSWTGYVSIPGNQTRRSSLLLIGLTLCIVLNVFNMVKRYFAPIAALPMGPIDLLLLLFAGLSMIENLFRLMNKMQVEVNTKTAQINLNKNQLVNHILELAYKVKTPLLNKFKTLAEQVKQTSEYKDPVQVMASLEQAKQTINDTYTIFRDFENLLGIEQVKAAVKRYDHTRVIDPADLLDKKDMYTKTRQSREDLTTQPVYSQNHNSARNSHRPASL